MAPRRSTTVVDRRSSFLTWEPSPIHIWCVSILPAEAPTCCSTWTRSPTALIFSGRSLRRRWNSPRRSGHRVTQRSDATSKKACGHVPCSSSATTRKPRGVARVRDPLQHRIGKLTGPLRPSRLLLSGKLQIARYSIARDAQQVLWHRPDADHHRRHDRREQPGEDPPWWSHPPGEGISTFLGSWPTPAPASPNPTPHW
jgi:hypothetical protein